ncbi:MAG: type II toxin-antitoxin system VapC family toxin [Nocardioides sp.]|uniref:type II toxin-antitoxin system VapC family toxin n=1 Tax=Nocardioides sp. TaxID=35761 RepID=UPI0039E22344
MSVPFAAATVCYLDASAAMKLLIEESESAAFAATLIGNDPDRRLVSSFLLHAELHCAAGRHPSVLVVTEVNQVLAAVDLFDLTRGDMLGAGMHSPLRSNDAIHLEVALRLGVDEIATYDQELQDAARRAGLRILAPAG